MTTPTPNSVDPISGDNIQRRTVLKGAAWSVPVLATAVAAPMVAATTTNPPACPACLRPGFGAFELAGLAASSRATLALASAVVLDATQCGSLIGNIFDFQPAFTYVVTQATLTMSDGGTYNSTLGLGPGAGVLGAVGAFPGIFSWSNVRVDPSNLRTGLPRERPMKLSVSIETTFKWGLGAQIICPNTLEWDLSAALNVGLLAVGAGAVTYTGVSTAI